ncbi:hypothetical protein [Vibrio phage vB_VpaP_C2]|nr:hypothetical protein [Vibrio phage vB_VpaP_C2]USL89966.1 hypothetical protein [Vibrio phage vB_VpaP_M3]
MRFATGLLSTCYLVLACCYLSAILLIYACRSRFASLLRFNREC